MVEGKPGLGIVEKGLLAARDGRIVYAGAAADAPACTAPEVVDCEGRWITPGLVDCHTHIVYGGNRAHEFELRLAGASYEEIARAGGGIVSTMQATRAASEDELVASALPRVDALLREGVTTMEVKSGYGLDGPNEMKSLRAARRLGDERQLSVSTTFPPNGFNWPNWKNAQFDALIDKIEKSTDPEEINASIKKAHEAIVDDAAWLFIVHDLNPRAMTKHVKGFVSAQSWFQDFTRVYMD